MPISRELVKAVIRRSFSARAVASGSMAGYLWPPTARSTAGEDFSLAGSIRKRGSVGILCLRPVASRRSPSARISRLRLCFVVPAVTDTATWRQPQNMLVQTNRAGGAAALPVSVVFRQRHCRLSSDVNWFRLGAFFLSTRPTLTLLAGDFVPGFQDCRERAGP